LSFGCCHVVTSTKHKKIQKTTSAMNRRERKPKFDVKDFDEERGDDETEYVETGSQLETSTVATSVYEDIQPQEDKEGADNESEIEFDEEEEGIQDQEDKIADSTNSAQDAKSSPPISAQDAKLNPSNSAQDVSIPTQNSEPPLKKPNERKKKARGRAQIRADLEMVSLKDYDLEVPSKYNYNITTIQSSRIEKYNQNYNTILPEKFKIQYKYNTIKR
jgi:hypothetical protein